MQLPFEIVGMDHPAHALNSEAYRALNPFQQIPVIDDDGVVLSESGAILIYLARKTGKLMPRDLPGEAQVLRWCMAAMNSLEMPLLNIQVLDWGQNPGCAKHREFLVGWAGQHLANLNRWLDSREYVATDSFTVADILTTHVLAVVKDQRLLDPHPRVTAYRDRCLARPAWQRTIAKYYARVEAA
jgi:glutathione S-transferase